MSDSADAHLQLKKRARRRLVGAIAIAGLAAVILPMVMDEEPKQQVQDVQIRIPGQDVPFEPKVDVSPTPTVTAEPNTAPEVTAAPAVSAVDARQTAEKPTEKPADKKVVAKATEPVAEKPKAADNEAQRAAAILGGKPVSGASPSPSTNGGGQFVILIGAFANPANVKQLQAKIGELGIKVFTEPLDSDGGKKTRVRAGPFADRDAAEKALGKMKRIGVNGVIAARK
jgi:DedD protein